MTAPKNILILGATGGTGRHVVSQALEHGYHVTAFVRTPERLTTTSERLRVLKGSADDDQAIDAALAGQDAVISALGAGQSFKSSGLIARSAPVIVRAMESRGVHRLIFVSAFGVGATWGDVPRGPRIFARWLLRDIYTDKAAGEEVVRHSDLDWTLVYPVMLTNGPKTGRYQVGEHLPLRGFPKVSRADVADFLLTLLDDSTYSRKGVLISG